MDSQNNSEQKANYNFVLDKFTELVSQPEKFVKPSTVQAELFTKLSRNLYSQIRQDNQKESPFFNKNALQSLKTGFLDSESLWNQIDSENKFFVKRFVNIFCEDQDTEEIVGDQTDFFDRSAQLLSDSDEDIDDNESDNDDSDENFDEQDSDQGENQEQDDEDSDMDERHQSDDDLEDETEQMIKRYNLNDDAKCDDDDDVLFKNNHMNEDQLKKELKRLEFDDGDDSEQSENEDFDKEMVYDDQEDQEQELSDEDEDNNVDDEEDNDMFDSSKSKFEQEDQRMKKNIQKLENQLLSEKPWQMKGEIDSQKRPQNSLLEEYVDFESGQRPAPVITEEFSKNLEKLILERIKDKKFDDVERKIKPVEQPFEYKRRMLVDTEKSKLSLAKIYENEYMKQRQGEEEEQKEPPEHMDVRRRMNRLFLQLDTLCNFTYTPKTAVSEIKIINNLPAITAEEAIPAAVSDAQMVAPQEIVQPSKRDIKGETEKSNADKTRERKLKKLRIKKRIQSNIRAGKVGKKTSKFAQKKTN